MSEMACICDKLQTFYDGKKVPCVWCQMKEIQCLRNQNAKLQAIVDKLPKYEDTGEAFVPGVDDCWVASPSGAGNAMPPAYYLGRWRVGTLVKFYSTREAAFVGERRETAK